MNDGPITAVFTVYQDFMNYAGGIYEHNSSKKNRKIGYHAVKVVGWGAAHTFSSTRTPGDLPGARTASSASNSATWAWAASSLAVKKNVLEQP